jgi:1-acyl-sn-glycerol-3-phosphate acyltransferase
VTSDRRRERLVFYRTVRTAFRVLAAPLFAFRVDGAENVPDDGAGVVVAPHRSWIDPACVGGACPRPVRFLVMESVYRLRWANWFFRGMCGVPVRSGGTASLPALRAAMRLLRDGHLVGVFPEGRVRPEARLGPVRAGAALLAVRGRAPVIPVGIRGSSRAWPHGRRWPGPARVSVRFGTPLMPPDPDRPAAVDELMAQIARVLHELDAHAEAL